MFNYIVSESDKMKLIDSFIVYITGTKMKKNQKYILPKEVSIPDRNGQIVY